MPRFASVATALAGIILLPTLAFAQAGGGTGGGAGSDVSVPRQNMQRPTPNSPPANRRGDDMAPMQGANVSGPMIKTKKVKHKTEDRTYR